MDERDGKLMVDALRQIARAGGNLPDDRLTSKTGPNDAAARGLMVVSARIAAIIALWQTDNLTDDDREFLAPVLEAWGGGSKSVAIKRLAVHGEIRDECVDATL